MFFTFEGNRYGLYRVYSTNWRYDFVGCHNQLGRLQRRFARCNSRFRLLLGLRCVVLSPRFVNEYETAGKSLRIAVELSQTHDCFFGSIVSKHGIVFSYPVDLSKTKPLSQIICLWGPRSHVFSISDLPTLSPYFLSMFSLVFL